MTDGDLDVAYIFRNALEVEGNGTVNLGPVVLGPVDIVGNTVTSDGTKDIYNFYAQEIFYMAAYTGNGEPDGSVESVTLGPVNISGNTLTSNAASPAAGDVGRFDLDRIAGDVGDGFDTPDFNGPVTLLDITFDGNTVMYGSNTSPVVSAGNLADNDNPNVSYGDVYITLNNIQNNTGDGLKVGTNNADSALTIWVTRNNIANNSGYGVRADAPAGNIEVHHNNIYCNRGNCAFVQAFDETGRIAEWDGTGPFLGTNFGNYWGTEFYADAGGPEGDGAAPIDPPTASWDVFDDLPVMEFMIFPFELAFTQVGGAQVDALLSPQPVVEVRDVEGNLLVTDNLTQVQLSVTGGGAVLTCDVNPVTAVAGVAVFSGCSIDATGTYTLTATGSLSGESGPINITAVPPPPPPGGRTGGGGGGAGGGAAPAATPTPTPTPTPAPTEPGAEGSGGGTVGDDGGAVGVGGGSDEDGGVTINFPPGSIVGDPVDVAITVTNTAPPGVVPPPGTTLLNKTIEVTPDMALGELAIITINLTDAEFDPPPLDTIMVGVVNPITGEVQLLPVIVLDPVNGIIQVLVDHFTKFTLFSVTDAGPVITAPRENAQLATLGPLLQRVNPEGTTQYQIQVVPFNEDGPGINLVIEDGAMVAAAEYQVMAPSFGSANPNYVMLPDMTYIWRVRTTTVLTPPMEEEWSSWSVRSFHTAATSIDSVSRVSPETDATVFWYEIQVSKASDFGSSAALYSNLWHGGLSEPPNSYIIPDASPLEAGTMYYWRVRPRIQGDGETLPRSFVYRFNTPAE